MNQITEVVACGKGKCVVAKVPIKAGTRIFDWSLRRSKIVLARDASRNALQLGENSFLELLDENATDNLVNHSCDPNCYIDWDLENMALIAARGISPEEELTFSYFTDSYDLETQGYAFDCECGNPKCKGRIRGFRYLSLPEKMEIRERISPFLRSKLNQELENHGLGEYRLASPVF